MPVNAASAPSAPTDLAWRVIGLLNLYRLLVPLVLMAVESFAGPQWALLAIRPRLFLSACIAYFTAGVLLVIARRLEWSSLRIVALVNSGVDAAAIGLILYASGGVSSGLGILLVLPVGAMAVLADHRDAFLLAAVAAIAVLAQQIFVNIDGAPSTDYTTAGVLGAVLFVIALSAWPTSHNSRSTSSSTCARAFSSSIPTTAFA
jgi:two-component system sensor histidine kinase PilS (NtrC family)